MLSTMKADNPKTVRPVNMLCAGIRIPNKAISLFQLMQMCLKIIR